jgi:hypothetical protein
MTTQGARTLLLAAGIALFAGGCGLLPGVGTPTASGVEPSVDPARRQAIFDAVDAKVAELAAGDPASELDGIAAFLRTIPELQDVQVSAMDGAVTATFVDGPFYVVADNRTPEDPGAVAPAPAPMMLESVALPAGRKAVILEATTAEKGWIGAVPVRNALQGAGYGIADVPFTRAGLRKADLSDVGVVYVDSHGATMDKSANDGFKQLPAGPAYALWTAETYSAADGETETDREDMKAGRLGFFTAKDVLPRFGREGTVAAHWAITGEFVKKYLTKIGPRALVYVDACESAKTHDLTDAFSAAGAAAFVGWSNPVHDAALEKIRGRVLGRLLDPSLDGEATGTPPYRPVDLSWVFDELSGKPLHDDATSTDGQDATYLWVNPTAPKPQLLVRPSLVAMDFDPNDGASLRIRGAYGFGSDPTLGATRVHVTVGGASVPVTSIAAPGDASACRDACPDVVTVKLPDTGAGSSGDVVVAVDAIKSNAVPLTEWRPVFRMSVTLDPPCVAALTWSLHLRADVHSFRIRPVAAGQAPTFGQTSAPVPAAPDSTFTWVVSGQDATATCSGSGSGVLGRDASKATPSAPVYMPYVAYKYAPTQAPAPVPRLFDITLDSVTAMVGTRADAGGSQAETVDVSRASALAVTHPVPQLDAKLTIPAGSASEPTLGMTMSWSDAPATAAPTTATPQ